MRALKGQSDIIAVVLIVLIAIGLLGVAYSFGLPLIQKNQDRALDDRVKGVFSSNNVNSLPAKIQSLANSGTKDSVTIDVSGATTLVPGEEPGAPFTTVKNNSIEFGFQSAVASFARDAGWIPLTGSGCDPVSNGIIGQDEAAVVCARVDSTGGGFYNVTYKVQFRTLEDAQKRNGFAIKLVRHPSSPLIAAGDRTQVRMEFGEKRTVVSGTQTLIITDVKVLLV